MHKKCIWQPAFHPGKDKLQVPTQLCINTRFFELYPKVTGEQCSAGGGMEMVHVGLCSFSPLAGTEPADMWRSGSEQGQLLLLTNSAFIGLLSSSSSATAIRPLCSVEGGKLDVPTRLARLLPNCFPQQLFDYHLTLWLALSIMIS